MVMKNNKNDWTLDTLLGFSTLKQLLKHNVIKLENIDNRIDDNLKILKNEIRRNINLVDILKACETGNVELMSLLINGLGIDLNIQDYKYYPGFSLLHIATCYLQIEICRLLVANGINIEFRDNFGRTALHWACHFGAISIVKLIIGKSIINVADHDGNTPLYLAANAGHERIVKLLMRNGASLKNHNGNTIYLTKNYNDGHYIVDDITCYIHDESTTIDGKTIVESTLFLGNDSMYRGQLINGAMEGTGVLICATGKYEGEFKDGEINGIGKLTMVNGNKYEGEFKNGEMSGNGKYTWASGNEYEGNFVDGEISGIGELICKYRGRYEGEFIDGAICGNGKYVDSRWGNTYIGAWLNGERHGYGTQSYTDGKYEGEWKYDLREGWGKFIYANKNNTATTNDNNNFITADGEYKNDTMTGKGKKITVNGDVYEGNIINFNLNGKGKMTGKDGRKYEGDFMDNMYHGQGKLTFLNGDTYEGDFLAGKIIGIGKMKFFDSGDIYEGEVLNTMMHGRGKVTWGNDGRAYEGDFINGKRTGQGKLTWPNGDVYQGSWFDNHIVGFGVNTYVNGTRYIGDHIVDNVMTGEGVVCYADGRIKAGYFKDGYFIKSFCMDE
jgi:hypothetical protein